MTFPPRFVRLHWPLLLAVVVALLAGLASPGEWRWATRTAMGWDLGVAFFLVTTVIRLARTRSTDDIRRRAAELDDAGSAVLPLSLIAAVASMAIVIGEAATATSHAKTSAGLVMTTVVLSWCFIHLIFAQHYAHGFYGPPSDAQARKSRKQRGGLIFPGETEPDYWDFIHFSLIIGVASQTADIQIADRRLRRIASIHSLTAFAFNTVILALAVNFAVNLLGNG